MASGADSYIIDGGEPGAARLAVLARLIGSTSEAHVRRAGIRPGARCLDVGCGSGEFTRRMAQLAAPGEVIGVDIDASVIAIANERGADCAGPAPEFVCADWSALPAGLGRFDIVFARLLLAHLVDPAGCVARMTSLCTPGGVVAVEDIDVAAAFSHPECEALDHLVELYRRAAEARGADARLGPKLPRLLEGVGLEDIQISTVQPTFRDGEGKWMMELSFRATRAATLASGLATEAEYDDLLDRLRRFTAEPGTLVSLPRIFQVLGRRPGRPAAGEQQRSSQRSARSSRGSRPIVAVVGPGRMGVGIASAFALSAEHEVRLVDLKPRRVPEQAVQDARARVQRELDAWAQAGLVTPVAAQAASRHVIHVTERDADAAVADAGVVFEAVPETMEVKSAGLQRVAHAAPEALIGSTTSSLQVDALAEACFRPERFLVTHWLNPAVGIPIVEVSSGTNTAPEAIDRIEAILRAAGKTPVRCAASPGYILTRIWVLVLNEAVRLLDEGVASADGIDTACRLGLGVRLAAIGPLEFLEHGGVRTLHHVTRYLQQTLSTCRYEPVPTNGLRDIARDATTPDQARRLARTARALLDRAPHHHHAAS